MKTWQQVLAAGMAFGWVLMTAPAEAAVIPVVKDGQERTVAVPDANAYRGSAAKSDTKAVKTERNRNDAGRVPATIPKELGPAVRVLLGARTEAFTVDSAAGLRVFDAGHAYRKEFKQPQRLSVAASGGQLTLNGKKVGTVVYIEPAVSSLGDEHAVIGINGTRYRGRVSIALAGNAMRIVNEVPMEHYIYGVVPKEAVPSWPSEALKAQAVAARTYALYTMGENKRLSYDLQPTVAHQVYGGKAAEFAATTAAVDATRGVVMTYGNKPVEALFHADGGGYTEDSVHVWGGSQPYLKGVKDFADNKDTSVWTLRLTRLQLESKLRAAGKDVGTLREIKVSPLKKRPMHDADRGVSGRIKSAVMVGSKRSITVSGESLMKILGAKSTLFDFYVNTKPPASADSLKHPKTYHRFKKANDVVFVRGYGWGHGLGLSQWGAAAMAQAAGNKKDCYQDILRHYYTGVTLTKSY